MSLNYRETDDACGGCGSTLADRRHSNPLEQHGLSACPHCGAEKCTVCDMGDNVDCGSCETGDADQG